MPGGGARGQNLVHLKQIGFFRGSMPGGGARGQNLVHFQNEVFLIHILITINQKAFRLGPEVQCRVSFHSMISNLRVLARGWGQGQNLVHL